MPANYLPRTTQLEVSRLTGSEPVYALDRDKATRLEAMGKVVFELAYRDRETGELRVQEVSEFSTAREVAKELAKASGHRAIISRKSKPDKLWFVHLVDTQTGVVIQAWEGLTKREVAMRWKRWKAHKTECVLVPWPERFRERMQIREHGSAG